VIKLPHSALTFILSSIIFIYNEQLWSQSETYVNVYNNLKESYSRNEKDRALELARELIDISYAEETDTGFYYAFSLQILAEAFSNFNQIDSAVRYFEVAVQTWDEQGRNLINEAAHCQYSLALLKRQLKNNDKALYHAQQALERYGVAAGISSTDYISCLDLMGILYYESGAYEMSEKFHRECLDKRIQYGSAQEDVANSYYKLGLVTYIRNDLREATSHYQKAFEIYKNIGSDYSELLLNLGAIYMENAHFIEAQFYFGEALPLLINRHGADHTFVGKCRNNIGLVQLELGNYQECESNFMDALRIYELNPEANGEDIILTSMNIGTLHYKKGAFKKAENWLEQSRVLSTKSYGSESVQTAPILMNLASLYSDLQQFEKAEHHYASALEIYKKTYGTLHNEYANCLMNIGLMKADKSSYAEAEEAYLASLDIYKKIWGNEHPDVALCVSNLGLLYAETGDFLQAEKFLDQALQIRLTFLDTNHLDIGSSLTNLGTLFLKSGRYEEAEIAFLKAKEISAFKMGEHHHHVFSNELNLGNLYTEIGKYKPAELCLNKALRGYIEIFGEQHSTVASCRVNLGKLYALLGDTDSADEEYKSALEIISQTIGIQHPEYATTLQNRGLIHLDNKNYSSAESLLKEALVILQKTYGNDHPDVALCLHNIGVTYAERDMQNEAVETYVEALKIYKKTLGSQHPLVAMNLVNLGVMNTRSGKFVEAEANYTEALQIYRYHFGDLHPEVALCEVNLAILHGLSRQYDQALAHYKKALEICKQQLDQQFYWLTDKERSLYWLKNKETFQSVVQFASKISQQIPQVSELAYDAELIAKALLLESNRSLKNAVAMQDNLFVSLTFAELQTNKTSLHKTISEGIANPSVINELKKKCDSLEKVLVNNMDAYDHFQHLFSIDWKKVQLALKENEAAIEFCQIGNSEENISYAALVLLPKANQPKMIRLGRMDSVEQSLLQRDFRALYELIWAKIDPEIKDKTTVYYSPCGGLNNVPFAALCRSGNTTQQAITSQVNRGVVGESIANTRDCQEYLMDAYVLHRLSSTRQLIQSSDQRKVGSRSATLLGGIDFDAVPKRFENESNEPKTDEAFHSNNFFSLVQAKTRSSNNVGKMMYLEGTEKEIQQIDQVLKDAQWKTLVYNNSTAEEGEIKQIASESEGILHIATHGFAFSIQQQTTQNDPLNHPIAHYRLADDPMVRCGLLLSGANHSWTGNSKMMTEKTGEDGILTALEMSHMDLHKMDLVVLSACETGLGKMEDSEGIYGLVRGFKMAGVQQLLVSLWAVPDQETAELMTYFYKELALQKNPESSFYSAQLIMRRQYPFSPEKWAGFVLTR
jgi:tetratricopeptide (TPR) repeat protein